MKVKFLLYCWLPVFLWCGLIFYLSSIPYLKTELGIWDLIFRKIAHFLEFGFLFLLFYRALKKSYVKSTYSMYKKFAIFSLLFTFLYAISDEYHQSFVPGRSGNIFDVMIDTFGGTFFAFFTTKYEKIKNP